MAEKIVKKRNWTFLLYPESAPEDWRERLQETGLPIAIGPLHDKDVNPGTGEKKKPHYHLLLTYSGPTSFNVVERLTKGLNQPIPKPVESMRGMYRYLTHQDNPEKAQYDAKDIQTLNGFDIRDFVEMSKTEADKIRKDILAYIIENEVVEYIDLLQICMADNVPADWFWIASSNTILFNTAIKSLRYKITGRRE